MVNHLQTLKLFLIGGLSAVAVSACAPSFQSSAYDASVDAGYGYSQSAYGHGADYGNGTNYGYQSAGYGAYGYQAAQTSGVYQQANYSGNLRGGCQTEAHPCGMMAVVPVYPVFQYVVTPPTPQVPTVEIYEPEPVVYVEPEPVPYVEPVYEPPVHHWPEPQTPVIDWKPLRK